MPSTTKNCSRRSLPTPGKGGRPGIRGAQVRGNRLLCATRWRPALWTAAVALALLTGYSGMETRKKVNEILTRRAASLFRDPKTVQLRPVVHTDAGDPAPPARLVLHVGPPKTGSTTIQEALAEQATGRWLRSDRWAVVASRPSSKITRKMWPGDLERVLGGDQPGFGNGTNLVGSNEDLGSRVHTKFADEVVAAVRASRLLYDVRVVVTYRRLHELLRSLYGQMFEKHPTVHMEWPDGDKNWRIPTFAEFLQRKIGSTPSQATLRKVSSIEIFESWNKKLPNQVHVFHFHQEGDLVANFVCQEIPGADTACRELSNTSNTGVMNPGGANYIDADILAVHAHERGLVHAFDGRWELVKAIERHLAEEGAPRVLPMACPEKEVLAAIHRASREHEEWARPHAPRPVKDFEAGWRKYLDNKKLCNVDAAAALNETGWKDFFSHRYSQIGIEATGKKEKEIKSANKSENKNGKESEEKDEENDKGKDKEGIKKEKS